MPWNHMGKIFYIMGKSASGKDHIYARLMQHTELNLKKMVLYTTRPIRDGEEEGKQYFFTDEEITRYQKQFENFNIEILKKTEERNKNIKDKLRDLVEEIFILNEMFDNEVEKEDLIQLLDVLIKTRIQQIKRNQ